MNDNYNEDNVRELMAELILALPGFNPVDSFKTISDTEKRYALAMMYKEKGFREYMKAAIFNQIGSLQGVDSIYGLGVQQGRIQALKELFMLSKQMFQESEKIDKAVIKPQE